MACKRSAVRSCLPPPILYQDGNKELLGFLNLKVPVPRFMTPSSRGLGHYPFTVSTGVRIPVGSPVNLLLKS
jgi:hypothetical protein